MNRALRRLLGIAGAGVAALAGLPQAIVGLIGLAIVAAAVVACFIAMSPVVAYLALEDWRCQRELRRWEREKENPQ